MKRTFLTVAAALACMALLAQLSPGMRIAAQTKPAVLVNMTSGLDDLHAISMGLGLAGHAAEAGHEVIVFLNVHTPVIAAADFDESVLYADFPPIKTMLANVIEKGAHVYACRHCTEVCGVDPDALVEGVTAASHHDLLERLPAGAVSFSF